MRPDEKALPERLIALLDEPAGPLPDELRDLPAEDLAEALTRIDADLRDDVLRRFDPEKAAYALIELPTQTARAIIDRLPDETVAHYLDILPMDDAVDLREELDPERFEALLSVIPQEDAEEIRRLLSYPEDSAGQLMTENFVAVGPDATMADVLDGIRRSEDERFETIEVVHVLSPDGHLLGILKLKDVIRAHPQIAARELMRPEPITAKTDDTQEEVARIIARYGFSSLPILDDRGRLRGIVTADDAAEILQSADTEDVLKLGAVSGDADAYLSLSILQLVKRRLPWLLVLFVAEFATGSVMRHYTQREEATAADTLTQLMLFVPLLIGAGGNAGSQVTTTITRALALGEVRGHDWFRVIRREFLTAAIVGGTLGTLGFLRSNLPFIGWGQPIAISLTVGLSLPLIVVWAAAVGSLLPIGAKAAGADPAVLSAPFITTFVDATGLIIFFEVARRLVEY